MTIAFWVVFSGVGPENTFSLTTESDRMPKKISLADAAHPARTSTVRPIRS
jgi:hypothetical protein